MTLTRQNVLEQFSNDDLVSHSYLDQSLPKCEEKNIQQLQSAASQLLSQLDYHSQDLTWTLDELLTRLTQSQNKIRYQIELLTGDLDSLKVRVEKEEQSRDESRDVNTINSESRDPNDDASPDSSREDITSQLQKYDSARRKMEAVIITLRQAKEFDQSKLDTQIDALITSGEYEKALNLSDEALQLAQVWKGTGGYNNRVKAIMASKKKIEREISKRDSVDLSRDTKSMDRGERESSVASSTKESSPMPEGFSLFGELSRRMGYN